MKVNWERRTNSFSSRGHRSITNRPSMLSTNDSPIERKSIDNSNNAKNNNSNPPVETPIQQELPPKPFKFKKSALLPPDPTAPIFIQFSKLVKSTSNIILRGIGTNRKDLKQMLNEAFDMFYNDFDSWWKNKNHISQRKDPTNLDISVLKKQLNECNLNIKPLRDQCHLWKSYKGYFNISVPNIQLQPIEIPQIQEDEEMKMGLKILVNGLDSISLYIQKVKSKRDNTNKYIDEIVEKLQFNLEIDYRKQTALRKRLCDGTT